MSQETGTRFTCDKCGETGIGRHGGDTAPKGWTMVTDAQSSGTMLTFDLCDACAPEMMSTIRALEHRKNPLWKAKKCP